MVNISVKPEIIQWAVDRSGLTLRNLSKKIPSLPQWIKGDEQPDLKQLEDFAKRTMIPLGYLFLPKPPKQKFSVPDYRTLDDAGVTKNSPNLLDTVNEMIRRQQWMRDYLIEQGHEELPFVGSVKRQGDSKRLANEIRETLDLSTDWAINAKSLSEARRVLSDACEKIGILVSINGIVGSNVHRKLDVAEFRGFVLVDDYVPLVFINGKDSLSAQIFTLVHEIVHVWMGKSGLFNLIDLQPSNHQIEKFCNSVAAELLVPEDQIRSIWKEASKTQDPFKALSNRYKVSRLVTARRALDLRLITKSKFFDFYRKYQEDLLAYEKPIRKGGDFYKTQVVRLGHKFTKAVIAATLEGKLLYRDAFLLTNLNARTFEQLVKRS